ncbi:MAG: class I SAM-dependent methyltransferase [Thermoleophilia bacterium]|nr:class I SAM-dependent methyltransferase [Thermoleophilia bacterium]
MSYDPTRPAAFFDEYGEREWSRFDDGRSSPVSFEVHRHYLRRFVCPRDRVLDVGAGPGRFAIELARLGARVTVSDVSRVQVALNERKLREARLEQAVEERLVADVTDLRHFQDGHFDATVCYGGPLSYALDRAPQAAAELVRVTRPGGHVLASAMSLVGAFAEELRTVLTLPVEVNDEIIATGYLDARSGGHVELRLFRSTELRALFEERGCAVVAVSASNLNTAVEREQYAGLDEPLREALVRWQVELCAEPGAVAASPHILVVARTPA